jgi:hypothetical protein
VWLGRLAVAGRIAFTLAHTPPILRLIASSRGPLAALSLMSRPLRMIAEAFVIAACPSDVLPVHLRESENGVGG